MKMSLRYHVLVILGLFGMVALMMTAAVSLARADGASKWDTAALKSVVRIRGSEGFGSGVIVGAKKTSKGWLVSIITNEHVTAHLCAKEGPQLRYKTCADPLIEGALESEIGKVIRSDAISDLALITAVYKIKPSVAVISVTPLYAFERVIAIGSGLGAPPFPTEGMISLPQLITRWGQVYILHSAPIISGNSGGGLFAYNKKLHRNELVGINEAIMLTESGPVPHMALAIPAGAVLAFLGTGA